MQRAYGLIPRIIGKGDAAQVRFRLLWHIAATDNGRD